MAYGRFQEEAATCIPWFDEIDVAPPHKPVAEIFCEFLREPTPSRERHAPASPLAVEEATGRFGSCCAVRICVGTNRLRGRPYVTLRGTLTRSPRPASIESQSETFRSARRAVRALSRAQWHLLADVPPKSCQPNGTLLGILEMHQRFPFFLNGGSHGLKSGDVAVRRRETLLPVAPRPNDRIGQQLP
jgi:hypothetical protein